MKIKQLSNTLNISIISKDIAQIKKNVGLIICEDENTKNVLVYDGSTFLYLVDTQKNDRIIAKQNFFQLSEAKSVNIILHSKTYKIFFIFTNTSIWILNGSNLELEKSLRFEYNYKSLGYIDYCTSFIIVNNYNIELLKLKINSNIHTCKLKINKMFDLSFLEYKQLNQQSFPNEKFYIQNPGDVLFTWNSQILYMYDLQNFEKVYSLKQISYKDNFHTSIFYSRLFNYLIVGFRNGNVSISRLKDKNTRQFVHMFEIHKKPIYQILEQQSNPKLIFTYSQDLSISLIDIQMFNLIIKFNLPEYYQSFRQINEKCYFCVNENNMIQIGYLNNVFQMAHKHNSEIVSIQKFYNQHKIYDFPGKSTQIQQNLKSLNIILQDNQGLQIQCNQIKHLLTNQQEATNYNLVQVYHAPPESYQILQIINNPYEENQVLMLTDRGELCQYQIQQSASDSDNNNTQFNQLLLQEMINLMKLENYMGIQVSHKPTCIAISPIIPKVYQMELPESIQQQLQDSHKLYYYTSLLNHYNFCKYERLRQIKQLTIGTEKGQIIFFSLLNTQYILTEFTYHKNPIENIQTIHVQRQDILLSVCKKGVLNLVGFQQNRPTLLFQSHLYNYTVFKILKNKIIMGFKSGFVTIFKAKYTDEIDKDQKINLLNLNRSPSKKLQKEHLQDYSVRNFNDKQLQILTKITEETKNFFHHEKSVICIEILENHQIYMSLGQDNKIKFVNIKRQELIYEISFSQFEIEHASICSANFDLLIDTQQCLYFIEAKYFWNKILQNQEEILDSKKVKDQEEQCMKFYDKEISLMQYFKDYQKQQYNVNNYQMKQRSISLQDIQNSQNLNKIQNTVHSIEQEKDNQKTQDLFDQATVNKVYQQLKRDQQLKEQVPKKVQFSYNNEPNNNNDFFIASGQSRQHIQAVIRKKVNIQKKKNLENGTNSNNIITNNILNRRTQSIQDKDLLNTIQHAQDIMDQSPIKSLNKQHNKRYLSENKINTNENKIMHTGYYEQIIEKQQVLQSNLSQQNTSRLPQIKQQANYIHKSAQFTPKRRIPSIQQYSSQSKQMNYRQEIQKQLIMHKKMRSFSTQDQVDFLQEQNEQLKRSISKPKKGFLSDQKQSYRNLNKLDSQDIQLNEFSIKEIPSLQNSARFQPNKLLLSGQKKHNSALISQKKDNKAQDINIFQQRYLH